MPASPFGFCGGEEKPCQVPHRGSPYEILTQILTACCSLNFHLKIITKAIWVEGLEDVSKWKYVNCNNFCLLYLSESPPRPGCPPVAFVGMSSHAIAPIRELSISLPSNSELQLMERDWVNLLFLVFVAIKFWCNFQRTLLL